MLSITFYTSSMNMKVSTMRPFGRAYGCQPGTEKQHKLITLQKRRRKAFHNIWTVTLFTRIVNGLQQNTA